MRQHIPAIGVQADCLTINFPPLRVEGDEYWSYGEEWEAEFHFPRNASDPLVSGVMDVGREGERQFRLYGGGPGPSTLMVKWKQTSTLQVWGQRGNQWVILD